jgi:molybdenum cofactor biosynthesis MoaF-like protein
MQSRGRLAARRPGSIFSSTTTRRCSGAVAHHRFISARCSRSPSSFTPRITFHSQRELTVEIIAGDNIGFKDTVDYELTAIREGLVLLSWQEHIGSTIVHVLDFVSGEAHTAVTPAKGGFMRLKGEIEVKSSLR